MRFVVPTATLSGSGSPQPAGPLTVELRRLFQPSYPEVRPQQFALGIVTPVVCVCAEAKRLSVSYVKFWERVLSRLLVADTTLPLLAVPEFKLNLRSSTVAAAAVPEQLVVLQGSAVAVVA